MAKQPRTEAPAAAWEKPRPPAMSAAERQAAYRARQKAEENGACRSVNVIMSDEAIEALRLLSAHFGKSQRAFLDQALIGLRREHLDGER